METNEGTFNFGGVTEASQPIQCDFSTLEKMDTSDKISTDQQPELNMLVDEVIKKSVDIEPIQAELSVTENNTGHTVNNADSEPVSDQFHLNDSELPPPLQVDPEPVKDDDAVEAMQTIPEEMSETEVNIIPNKDDNIPDDVEMVEDVKETVEDPIEIEPDSTPEAVNDTNNDAHSVENETKVEEMIGDSVAEDDIKESTTEPLIEEPTDVSETPAEIDVGDKKDDVDADTKDGADKVEISDVTEKEEELLEEKKSDEELLIEHLNTAFQCLDDFMKTKDEIKIKDCMSLLSEIKSLTEKTVDSLKAASTVIKDADKGHGSKKSKGRGKVNTKQSKSVSKVEKSDGGAESDSPDPLEDINLKDIKGLAVFAKWPNSGWFYPGVVKDLALSDWKTSQNITVTFYDGLERDMKSINIFPAELIPASSVLFDLDDETDMIVSAIEKEDNWIKYIFSNTGEPDIIKDFDKMAIKGAHMKTIKQSVDTAALETTNKTEAVVSGRRARGKSSVFNEDYVSTSSPRSTEKRKTKLEDSKTTPAKTPAKRKSSSKDDESGDSTPSRSTSKRRQVNGTKSTPRRAAKK